MTTSLENVISRVNNNKQDPTRHSSDYFLPFTKHYDFHSILDIGMGSDSRLVEYFINQDKEVYSIDIEKRNDYDHERFHFIKGNFLDHSFDTSFDAVWASHVLEHVQNTGIFLDKVYDILNEDGIFFVMVPPHKTKIVGGHVTTGWNIGLLMYNLILAGFNVREGRFKKYGYNVAGFVRKRKTKNLPNDLLFINTDIKKLKDHFPQSPYFIQGFEGDMEQWNWFND